eukprot:TRINITY_DN602_c0_g1_i5.p1 TRINITY_DN602_c0_g1~~TRINITY_DN602_c0_g1_i5.p1  ORF type:complete len:441 (+),score=33.99 TRINITY_DN602_c0_g1_i5:121-1323(+)
MAPNTISSHSFFRSVQQFVIKNFLVIGLLLALIIGLAYPLPGDTLGSLKAGDYSIIKTINVCFIFFISGLTLRTSEIKSALSAYLAFAYAITAILIITPLAGYIALEIPYQPYEFAIGLAVFCVVPTTLTSGATLVMQANANYALALMVTVCSNVLGVVTVPFALKIILEGVAEGVAIDAVSLLIKLLLTILLPLLLGKAVRHCNPRVLRFGKAHKVELSMLNNGSLVMVVWQTISQSQDSIVNTKFTSILLLILSGIGLHFLYLTINFVSVKLARWEVSEQRAVLLIASQKTLPVAITIISYFGAEVGDQGLITLPCIIGHLSQLFIDSFLVARMVANDTKQLKNQQRSEKNVVDVEKAKSKDVDDDDVEVENSNDTMSGRDSETDDAVENDSSSANSV